MLLDGMRPLRRVRRELLLSSNFENNSKNLINSIFFREPCGLLPGGTPMAVLKFIPKTVLLLPVAIVTIAACSGANNHSVPMSDAAVEKKAAPLYISQMQVSTDCGIADSTPPPFPGFADRPKAAIQDMAPPVAAMLTVGADRPMVETDHDRVSPGYVLIEPAYVKEMFLVNNDKEVVATFENDYFSFTQLQDDGSRLASSIVWEDVFQFGGGQRGCLEEYGADGSLKWRVRLATENYIQHHDMVKLDSGNVLTLVWERVPAAQAVALGRNPEHVAENGEFWFDGIIEVNPKTAEIVWEWSLRHHVIQDFDPSRPNYGVVADHPERLDINAIHFDQNGKVGGPDWTHANALDYNPELDQIIFSSNYLSEVYVIDHGITPYESQGRAGDFLYRWGNPENWDRGTADDRRLYNQHDVHWIKPGLPGAGDVMIFNNGDGQLRPYTTVLQFSLPTIADGAYVRNESGAYGPGEMIWEYDPPDDEKFLSFFISGAQRLPNGNTLVTQGAGAKVREVTADGEIVWEYGYQDETDAPHMLFRAYRFAADHPAIVGILEQVNR